MMKSLDDFYNLSKDTDVDIKLLIREYFHKFILLFLNQVNFFSDGVFQGGTCLRIVYNNVRFSEDLYFVFQNKNSIIFKNLGENLKEINLFLKNKIIFLENVDFTVQKENNNLKRYKITFKIEKIGKISINLEFANIPSYLNKIEIIKFEIYNYPLKCETKEEILIDKIVAFGLRDYIKGRDIWDIDFLIKEVKVIDYNLILKKIKDYNKDKFIYFSNTMKNLNLLNSEGEEILINELKRFLPKNIYSSVKSDFKSIVFNVSNFIKNVMERIYEIK